MTEYHEPVLVDQTLQFLEGASRVLDCTLGDGGHAERLLEAGVRVVALDRDPGAVARARRRLQKFVDGGRLEIYCGNFADIESITELSEGRFDGILLDLGVSSRQLDDHERGFTFRPGAPLDMRMGRDALSDAAALLNSAPPPQLEQIFRDYADEPRARRLAREVVRRRENALFATSDDLVGAVRAVLGPRSGASEFARIFQGVRIAVNDELRALTRALPVLRERLKPSGVLVVISYHSGEDRLVKHAFRDWTKGCTCPPRQPVCTCGNAPLGALLTRRAVVAGDEEIRRNPRARSARLRAWRRSA